MANDMDGSSSEFSAQEVGHAFVSQFYRILYESPELVHKFYQDSSTMSCPGSDGALTTATTMKGINDLILSLHCKDYKAEIMTADAQTSYMEGVIVLVTGCLTGKDNVRRKFTESFFLAPQEKGYFVLNDVFRFVDDDTLPVGKSFEVKKDVDKDSPAAPDPESTEVLSNSLLNHTAPAAKESITNNNAEAHDTCKGEERLTVGEAVIHQADSSHKAVGPHVDSSRKVVAPHVDSSHKVVAPTVDSSHKVSKPVVQPAFNVQEETPKKSYLDIVKFRKDSAGAAANASNAAGKTPSSNTVQHSHGSVENTGGQQSQGTAPSVAGQQQQLAAAASAVAPDDSGPNENNGRGRSVDLAEDKGFSIYIGRLPSEATVEQVESEFKRFGPIKRGGVQVRSNQDFCFGFVEFESQDSMQAAIKMRQIHIGGQDAYIEEKKTTTRVSNGVRSSPSGRGGSFRNGRNDYPRRGDYGNYPSGRGGYGRNDYGRRGDFSNGARSGDAYQKLHANEGSRGGRQGDTK
ncbi:hypothetical protein Ancab_020891 [Ancistrocladus abbreviatus]